MVTAAFDCALISTTFYTHPKAEWCNRCLQAVNMRNFNNSAGLSKNLSQFCRKSVHNRTLVPVQALAAPFSAPYIRREACCRALAHAKDRGADAITGLSSRVIALNRKGSKNG
jgi:hypothetical protein